MAVTRINNNQITDSSAGNLYLGIDASTKLQNYSVTAGKLANSLVYGSDFTVSGNLTVNGTTTTVDTVNTLIQDPLITLADGQTAGTPTVDIGTIGLRGSELSAVMAWKESDTTFVAALSNTTVSNTTFNLNQYADFKANTITANSNLNVSGTTSLVGNIISDANVTGNVNGGNLLTAGLVSATGTITGGNLNTSGNVSATGNITASYFIGNISGNIDAAGSNTQVQFNDTGDILGASAAFTFDKDSNVLTVSGNIAGGNLVSPTVTNPTAMTVSTDAGNINLSPTGNIVVNNTYINGLQLTPLQDGDAASKYYVDTIATTGLTFHEAVFATTNTTLATATGGTISYTQPNGVSNGIGAYIQTTGTFTTIDTANVQTVGTRILVKNEANAVLNGVYTYSNATAIVRSTDADQYGAASTEEISINDYFFTTNGNVNAGAAFVVDAPAGVITFGTSNISFAQFSSSQTYTANTAAGLVLVNQQFNAKVDENTTAFDGGGNIIVKAGANLTTPNIGDATGTSLSVTGTVTAASTVGGVITGSSASLTGNITGGNLLTSGSGGEISGSGNITGGNILTSGNVVGGNISTTGELQGGNIVISGDDITDTNGRVNFNTAGADVDFAVNGDTVANVFYVDAATGTASFGSAAQTTNAIVAFNTSTSILAPVGNTAQRPATGVTGMLRFNTSDNNLELYDNSAWTAVGVPVFTVIADEQFNGDGSTVAFTLSSTQTTNSCIVSINGVVQIPTLAYAVAGTNPTCVLTFTEAPEPGDIIDVREITTTTSVTSIANSSGNAVVAVSPTTNDVNITGDIIPTGNGTQAIGSNTNRFSNIWLTGSTITLGNTVIKNTGGNTIGFFGPDGSTPATIDAASVDTTTIANGTSKVAVVASGGNIVANVGGATVQTISAGLVSTTGNLTAIGNITGGNLSISGTISVTNGIVNGGSNAVGNIGSSTTYFNTVFAKATSAQYADLAEKYTADAEYAPGTVVVFGGTHEVTVDAADADRRVAGVISTNPSYIMNGGLEADHVATVALTGRVPTLVVGSVRKGDLMVAAGLGRARAEADPRVGTVIGKALEDFDGAEGTIEVVVGRF